MKSNLLRIALLTLLPLSAALAAPAPIRIDFSKAKQDGDAVTGWTYKGKMWTPDARFSIQTVDGKKVLRMESRKGTGSLLFDIASIDLEKYPYMRWKWRVDILPAGADGQDPDKDDQAIGLYIGSGSSFSQESVAFRWETVTPKGKTGFVKYGMGAVKVHWICVRNKTDGLKKWIVEECDLRAELKKIFGGKIPAKKAITLSANSQYTGTASLGYLEYIEFSAEPMAKPKK
ncbi:MAG: DUF3047 domain-containing protein [Lentisphaeria bacterium]|nr:DUF3047 domain-containing protein [Lentisphaeria bacterium]